LGAEQKVVRHGAQEAPPHSEEEEVAASCVPSLSMWGHCEAVEKDSFLHSTLELPSLLNTSFLPRKTTSSTTTTTTTTRTYSRHTTYQDAKKD
jgi:hypothetical protein